MRDIIQGFDKADVDHGGAGPLHFQLLGGFKGGVDAGAQGQDEQILALP